MTKQQIIEEYLAEKHLLDKSSTFETYRARIKACRSIRRLASKHLRLSTAICNGAGHERYDDLDAIEEKMKHHARLYGIMIEIQRDPRGWPIKAEFEGVNISNLCNPK